MKFEIKNRFSGELIFSVETDNWRLAIEAAIKSKADLSSADLSSADLSYANLRYANLRSADLSSADLSYADLRYANLRYANLRSANLRSANLRSADLRSADLSSANFRYADLSSVDLRYAKLSSADLSSTNLSDDQLVQFRDDIWAVLSSSPSEVEGLRKSIFEGKIDGSTYEGECACLVGTIAKVAETSYQSLPILKPNSGRPAEVFFALINIGDTPEKSKWTKMALEWVDLWLSNMKSAFGVKAA